MLGNEAAKVTTKNFINFNFIKFCGVLFLEQEWQITQTWGLATSHSTVLWLGRMLGTATFHAPCSRNRARPLRTAALASFWYWDMHILIWCFAGSILRQKTIVFRNSAEQNKLTALNNNSKNSLKTHALARPFFFWRRTRKTCEGFTCALAIYLWASVSYRITAESTSQHSLIKVKRQKKKLISQIGNNFSWN